MAFTPGELSFLHTILEGRAEVLADQGDHTGEQRLTAMVNDDPVISSEEAEILLEHAQDFDDYDDDEDAVAIKSLRAKLAALIEAYKALDNFYLTLNEDNEDTPEMLAEQERLFDLIKGLNGDCRR